MSDIPRRKDQTMTNEQVLLRVFDRNTFRIGALFWLATCNDGECFPRDLSDEIEDGDEVVNAIGAFPANMDKSSVEDVCQWLIDERKLGFLARVETPIPTEAHKNGYSSRGWGYYSNDWVYAESLDELLDKAEQASKASIDRELAMLRAENAKAKP